MINNALSCKAVASEIDRFGFVLTTKEIGIRIMKYKERSRRLITTSLLNIGISFSSLG
jgi:hypothetical protein